MPFGKLTRWRFGVVLSTCVLGSWNTAEPARALTSATVVLEAVEAPGALGVTYGLPVVPVPPIPETRVGAATMHGCPFEVRAIVGAEEAAESSALVAWDNDIEEAETQLLKVGQALRVGGVLWQVSRIETEQLVLTRGDAAVRCALAKITR